MSFLDAVEVDADLFLAGDGRDFEFRELGARQLASFAREFDLGLRALSLSLGTPGALDARYLGTLKQLTHTTQPSWVSGHIAFSRVGAIDLGALLPVAPSRDCVEVLTEHVIALSDTLGTSVLLENIFSPLRLRGTLRETEFINRLCQAANCGFLLNIDVLRDLSARGRLNPAQWIRDIDPLHIKQLRIGFSSTPSSRGSHEESERDRLLTETLRHASISRIILEPDTGGTDLASLAAEVRRIRALVKEALEPAPSGVGEPQGAVPSTDRAGPATAPASFKDPTSGPSLQDDAGSRIRILPGVDLLFLGDGGILFSQPHQELHELNSSAAFVWHCLEEGQTLPDIVQSYAAAFGTDIPQAEELVFPLLESWQSLGFIAPFPTTRLTNTDLSRAIAYLMRNPMLRQRFRESPNEVARLLNVAPDVLDTFLAIDADELEQQARLTEKRRRWIRSPQYAKQGIVEQVSPQGHESDASARLPAFERRYRLLNTVFQLEYADAREFDQVHPAIQHLAIESRDEPDVVVRIVVENSSIVVLEEGQPQESCADIDKLTPLITSRFRRIAASRYDFLAKIHAGVVSNGSACAVLPAEAGSGKTTLVAALVASGLRYFSDEYALLKSENLDVAPVPFAMTVKDGAVDVLRPHYPGIDELPVHVRIDNVRVRYLLPPPARCAASGDRSMPVRWVIFPRYGVAEETRLIAVEPRAALRRLLDQCLVLPEELDRHKVQRLIHWFRNVACYELPFSSLTSAVKLIGGLMAVR